MTKGPAFRIASNLSVDIILVYGTASIEDALINSGRHLAEFD